MAAKLTPWFDGSVKPAHVGWYERGAFEPARYWFFDGKRWEMGGWRVELLARNPRSQRAAPSQSRRWRGLAQKPAKKAKG